MTDVPTPREIEKRLRAFALTPQVDGTIRAAADLIEQQARTIAELTRMNAELSDRLAEYRLAPVTAADITIAEQAARLEAMERDAFQAGYIQGHEATLENRYNLEGATADFLADAAIDGAKT